ncbi:hypothetical protein L9F63_002684, partial [Diploptera punctata]
DWDIASEIAKKGRIDCRNALWKFLYNEKTYTSMSEAGQEHVHCGTALGSSVVVSSHDDDDEGSHPTLPTIAALHEKGTPPQRIKPIRKSSRPSRRTSQATNSQLDDIEWDFGSDDENKSTNDGKSLDGDTQNVVEMTQEIKVKSIPGIVTRTEVIKESFNNNDVPFDSSSEFAIGNTPDVIVRSKVITSDFIEGERSCLMDAPPLIIKDGKELMEDDDFKGNGDVYENRRYQGSIHSDSDCDSRGSPLSPESRVSFNKVKTFGSSSGSDVALHEGTELSEDEQHSGAEFFQGNEDPVFTETVTTEFDPNNQRRVVTTVRTVTMTSSGENDDDLRQSMQEIVDKFMTDERQQQP